MSYCFNKTYTDALNQLHINPYPAVENMVSS